MSVLDSHVVTLENNPSLSGMAEILPDVVFSTPVYGHPLKMQIIAPWRDRQKETKPPRRPAIVFVQGSGWKFPNVYFEIPQLSWYAKELGYVVATVTHRSCMDGWFPFPAYLQDVKTAIRFLRAHADEYGIDPERIGIWGTSSGGNTALLAGATGDEERYRTWEWDHYSDKVRAVVECFGPTDLEDMLVGRYDPNEDRPGGLFYQLLGGRLSDRMETLREMSPVNHIRPDGSCPPCLLLHGDADPVVPYRQGELMLKKLLENGVEANMVRIHGGVHEHSFWSEAVHRQIAQFWKAHL